MRKVTILLALLPLSSACFDLNLTGLDLCWDGCGPYTPPVPRLSVTGTVTVGDYQAMWNEATLLVYAPTDTIEPWDSIPAPGGYYIDFGESPVPDACDYLARAVLWTGEETALQPLFASAEPCEVSNSPRTGSAFQLPGYPELDAPFTVWGRVRVDAEPAAPGDVVVSVFLRPGPSGSPSEAEVSTDDEGRFLYETTDGAQRFWFCSGAGASVRRSEEDTWVFTGLGVVPDDACGSAVEVPEVRLGTTKAAHGWIYLISDGPTHDWLPVGAGEARVALLDPADSTVVGEEYETYADGSMHVWFPDEMQDPGCDWLVRAELVETGEAEIKPLREDGETYCYPDIYKEFAFGG